MTDRKRAPLRTGGMAWGPERVALGVSIARLSDLTGLNKAILSLAENGRLVPKGSEYQKVMDALRLIREGNVA